MGHDHIVLDDDLQFTIDPSTRLIDNQSGSSFSLMQADHNSELFTFELPRMIEGHDMLECDVVQVHYTNTGTGTSASVRGVNQGLIELTDLRVNPENEENLICSWLLSQEATQLAGTLKFQLKFKCRDTEDSTKFSYIWSTRSYEGITIIAGINNSEAVVTEYADVLEQWRDTLFGIEIISIVDIQKTSSSGYVDTYTITMTNGSTSTFTVTNGIDGLDVASVKKTASEGLVDTYTITMSDGSTHTFEITNGDVGVGIVTIEKTSTEDLVDTYTITMSDGSTTAFTVTNGKDAPLNHTHSTTDITDFPETMPPSEHTHDEYETKKEAQAKLDEAKTYADTSVANLVDSAPETLDTLNELAAALKDNADIIDVLEESIGSKAEKEHEHVIDDVTGLQGVIDDANSNIAKKANVGNSTDDSSVAYIKDVPEDVLPYAEVKKVGGMTRKCANLIPYPYYQTTRTTQGITFTDNGDGTITGSGDATGQADFDFLQDGTLFRAGNSYTLSLAHEQSGVVIRARYKDARGITQWKSTFNWEIGCELERVYVSVYEGTTLNNFVIKPMLNEGTTALPYEPYFEGLRSAKVTEVESVGENLFDKTKATFHHRVASDNGTVASGFSEVSLSDYINVKGISTFYISGDAIQIQTEHSLAFFDANKVFISGESTHAAPVILTNKMYNVPSNACYVRFNFAHSAIDNIQFEVGATASPYTPYVNHTLPIPVEVRGSMNIFGGLAFANKIKEVNPNAVVDTSTKTVSYSASDVRETILLTNFKANTRYTFIIRGLGTGGFANIGISYTDGTNDAFTFDESNTVGTIVKVSSEGRSIESFIGVWSTGSTTLYYEDCGVFEGVLSESDFDPYGITGLDGYGLGVSETAYNYIDLEDKTFVKECGEEGDLGALDWTVVDGENYAYSLSIRNSVKQFGAILHSGLPTGIATMNIDSASAIVVIFKNATFSVDSLKAALSGVMLVYELATPEVTDISDLLSEDNFIGVEGNGTITFKNAYEYAVPSEITLYEGNNEIVGSKTFVGDLVGEAERAKKAVYDESGKKIDEAYAQKEHTHLKAEITDFPETMPPSEHTHLKAEITDFPSSMPASDVYSWAKASSKPSYSWNEITSKPGSFTPADHTHRTSEITDFPSSMPASDVYSWAKASSKPSYSWDEIVDRPSVMEPLPHSHDADEIRGGELRGQLIANGTAVASLGDPQVRNIYVGTSDMTAGSSALPSGDIYIVYE